MIPTLLIHGSQDKAVPLKDAVAASKLIPDCELYIMKGCKHWPQKERPEEFSQAVDDFVTQQIGQTGDGLTRSTRSHGNVLFASRLHTLVR